MEQGEHAANLIWVTSHDPDDSGRANPVYPTVAMFRDGELHVPVPDELLTKIGRDAGTLRIDVHRDAG